MVRVAVIDDSREFVELIGEALALRGWESSPHTCTDGLLQALRKERLDVILLDLWLGRGVQGWDLIVELERDPVLHAVPVIVCSAAGNEARDRADWLADRGIGMLEKPFDIDDLYLAVERALARSDERLSRHA
jgi:DNA-binding NtrC family response regulator